jgi:hypothetical protein
MGWTIEHYQEQAKMTGYYTIYGHRVLCNVLRVHPAGTHDVEVIEGKMKGRCYRVSGLAI